MLRGRFKEPAVECSTIFNWTEFNILSDIIDIYIFFFLHVDLNDSFKKK